MKIIFTVKVDNLHDGAMVADCLNDGGFSFDVSFENKEGSLSKPRGGIRRPRVTMEKVREIDHLLDTSSLNDAGIAAKVGVSVGTVGRVRRGEHVLQRGDEIDILMKGIGG